MGVSLRPHQLVACEDVDGMYYRGLKTVCMVLPTGAGKTLCKAEYARRDYALGRVCILLAHRDVLLGQISDACCLMDVPHSFICAKKTERDITNANLEKYGDSFYDEVSPVIVVSVNTLVARIKAGLIPQDFLNRVYRWCMDETHHLTKGSMWGTCVEAFPNALGLGVTATPIRGDMKGLGAHADGYFQDMSVTTNMWDLIKSGRLTPYKIFAPDTIDTRGIKKDKNGEFNNKQLHMKTKEAGITGSSVDYYKRTLMGKPVITFAVNIEHAIEVAKEFNDNGIPTRAVSSKTPLAERNQAIADLRSGHIWNLVNVDLFGEGFDAPAVMGVIMLRKTESYSLFKQQFGRMLRPFEGKEYGVLLDHVGNTKRMMEKYGLLSPHDDPVWTLDNMRDNKKRDESNDGDLLETMECPECNAFGLIVETDEQKEKADTLGSLIFVNGICPECGHRETEEETEVRVREVKTRKGELIELNIDAISELINKRNDMCRSMVEFAETVDGTPFEHAAKNTFATRQHALNILRHWIQEWCRTHAQSTNKSVNAVQMDFELTFGVNIFKGQVGAKNEMNALTSKIQQQMRL